MKYSFSKWRRVTRFMFNRLFFQSITFGAPLIILIRLPPKQITAQDESFTAQHFLQWPSFGNDGHVSVSLGTIFENEESSVVQATHLVLWSIAMGPGKSDQGGAEGETLKKLKKCQKYFWNRLLNRLLNKLSTLLSVSGWRGDWRVNWNELHEHVFQNCKDSFRVLSWRTITKGSSLALPTWPPRLCRLPLQGVDCKPSIVYFEDENVNLWSRVFEWRSEYLNW